MEPITELLAHRWGRTIYIRIKRDEMIFRHIQGGVEVCLHPQSPFSSARLLVARPSAAGQLVRRGIKAAMGSFGIAPTIVFHPLDIMEGGLSEVEEDSLLKLGYDAGARSVAVVTGAEFSDVQVREILKERSRLGAKAISG